MNLISKYFLPIITLTCSLYMASIAAWFSIVGIVALFSASPIAALCMGIGIEASKLVGISWLYRNWKEPVFFKYFLLIMVVCVALLTSWGIFGFLSKAHIEQSAPTVANTSQIEYLQTQIDSLEAKVASARKTISGMDAEIDVLIEYKKISDPKNGARAVREQQKELRDELSYVITNSQKQIDALMSKKYELTKEVNLSDVKLGPVKYFAEVIFEDAEENMDKAVRIVILFIIFVFDPMAILLLMAASHSFIKLSDQDRYEHQTYSHEDLFLEESYEDGTEIEEKTTQENTVGTFDEEHNKVYEDVKHSESAMKNDTKKSASYNRNSSMARPSHKRE